MKYVFYTTITFMVLCVVGLVAMCVVAIMAPTCEEQGGHSVMTGYTTTVLLVGKVIIPQTVPLYQCVRG